METIFISIGFIIAAIIYLKIATKFNIVDNPNFRSSHTIPTIRGGGILFLIAVLAFFISSNFQYPYFVAGLTSIAIVSFLDDILTLSAKLRLPFQFLAIGLVLYQLAIFSSPLWIIALVLIVAVAFINIYNFMDGINGITGLYSLAVLSILGFINYNETILDNRLVYYLAISILVFGFYNFRKKARMFAGDIGSISIAMALLFIGGMLIAKLEAPILLLAVAIYGIDSGLTILYRLYLKEHIMEPHRHHVYQKLVDVWKWSHLKVSLTYMVLQLLVNVLVFFFYKENVSTQWMVLVVSIVILSTLYIIVFKKTERLKLK
ncbi:glycosyltransferase family 4 protein [Lutibacter sp. TH_r2]|uniref:MraY family glycosyltransferase n=1 Tax=Lutibacter sp. TH_r2 TaxID=3082083 RepID=UPI0029559117|nr:glycosyltransferase family 4 protein [Lutibacter sp. TH_r2]MDV7187785.1 glycosyltransferase family 4 protein [Lutibacter sp. TH_r2]